MHKPHRIMPGMYKVLYVNIITIKTVDCMTVIRMKEGD